MVIILNGPPGSGKDTIANELLRMNRVVAHVAFKDALHLEVAKYFNLPVADVVALASDREAKEQPHWKFNNKSPREAYIHVSEKIIKPNFGKDYFGIKLVDRAREVISPSRMSKSIVVSDGGFAEEVYPLLDAGYEVLILRLYRDGCTFEGDSRGYMDPSDFSRYIGFGFGNVHNNGCIDDTVSDVLKTIEEKWRWAVWTA